MTQLCLKHRDTCSSIPTQNLSSVLKEENFICMLVTTTYQFSNHWLSHWSSPEQGDHCLHGVSPLVAQFAYRCPSYFLKESGAT